MQCCALSILKQVIGGVSMRVDLHETVSATELVRNLSALIDKVRISGRSLHITKGSQTVAELNPPPKTGLLIGELELLLASLPTLGKDGHTLADDIKHIRKYGQLPENPWG